MCNFELVWWYCPVCTGPSFNATIPQLANSTALRGAVWDKEVYCREASCPWWQEDLRPARTSLPYAVKRHHLVCKHCRDMPLLSITEHGGLLKFLWLKFELSRYVPDILTPKGRHRRWYWADEKHMIDYLRKHYDYMPPAEPTTRMEKFVKWFKKN
ncbi:hypothetical protein CONLIGDRAFT_30879 [Coniochaeta ligniaria NRRL 30616]|uniref:Uncharacterized protein n=1 Tax=Coniochaeta ligniaria NRRL 30616 TaxID=1408157 RepID=A0A1J7JXS5_9PEZI|nr:hypothetical protein CONLIGDRAFT_30879 [Coniochaeta ligniaria NRRL 30616]